MGWSLIKNGIQPHLLCERTDSNTHCDQPLARWKNDKCLKINCPSKIMWRRKENIYLNKTCVNFSVSCYLSLDISMLIIFARFYWIWIIHCLWHQCSKYFYFLPMDYVYICLHNFVICRDNWGCSKTDVICKVSIYYNLGMLQQILFSQI